MPNAFDYAVSFAEMQECFFSSRRLSSGKCIYGAKPRSRFYDAENRLINARNYATSPVTGSQKIDFVYDYMSRRVRRTQSTYTSGAWSVTDDRKFVYQGWNVVAELNATSNGLLVAYTWGLDLSQSLSGAGGVGGLLAVTTTSPTTAHFFTTYDGNGNVSEYINSAGAVEAHFAYDPFGQTSVATGTNLSRFVYRFSTKYLDLQTGLYGYGLRDYDPSTGRWPNRDPIEESGGENIYAFIQNDAVGGVDRLGLAEATTLSPLIRPWRPAVGGPKPLAGSPALLGAVVAGAYIDAALIAYDVSLVQEIIEINKERIESGQRALELSTHLRDEREKKAAEEAKRCNKCVILWMDAIGTNKYHDAYVRRKFGSTLGVFVVTPEGIPARYDSGTPGSPNMPKTVYELKTGHYWMGDDRSTWNIVYQARYLKLQEQLARFTYVARRCELNFEVWLELKRARDGFVDKFPVFSPLFKYKP